MSTPQEANLLEINQQLLDSIAEADWNTYSDLCDDSLTCFEPEARGHLVEGLGFHRYYFELGSPSADRPVQNTICSPTVRVIGEVGIVTFTRLVQVLDAAGHPMTKCVEETRIWQRISGDWKHIHFHRSLPS